MFNSGTKTPKSTYDGTWGARESVKSSLDGYFDARAVQLVVDYDKSRGN
jgi:hypothetical protein